MPSSSKSQYKLMQFAAMNKSFAEKKGIKQETAKEWHEADKKKKAEDPEWYENLPEKFEKKKKDDKGEVSTEGLGSLLGGLFKGKDKDGQVPGHTQDQFIDQAIQVVHATYLNEAWLGQQEFKTGPISVSDQSHRLAFPNFPTNLLDAIEKSVNVEGTYMLEYAKRVHGLADELLNKWHSIKDHATAEQAETDIEKIFDQQSKKIDSLNPPLHMLGCFNAKRTGGGTTDWLELYPTAGIRISTIGAFTKDQVRKAGWLIVKILGLAEKHSDLFYTDRHHIFDGKDEWKHLGRNGKDPDHYHKIFAILDFEEFAYENDRRVRDVLVDAARALDVIANRSIK